MGYGRSSHRAAETPAARTVVVASGDAEMRQRLRQVLTMMRWDVREAGGGAEAMAQLEAAGAEALLVDSWLPDLEVEEFAGQMRGLHPEMDMLRFDGGADDAGARSPRRNELLQALREAERQGERTCAVLRETLPLREAPGARTAPMALPDVIGGGAQMAELARLVRLVAPRSATVLIEGATGTGKELVAKAVHRLSTRSAKAFVVLNCAAIPESLLEAELFGHTRGAFTGAVQSRTGRVEAAGGGTLFLDEIGEIDANTQVKILRALDPGVFERVGGNQTIKTDVRLITATNKNLGTMVRDGKFRDDLYYRLNVVNITMPALRERKEDIPLLVNAFLKSFAKENGKPVREFTSDAMQAILSYDWPGNVRELRTAVEHGVVMATGARITLRDLPAGVRSAAGGKGRVIPTASQPYNLQETGQRLIERAMSESNGNVTEAARKLGISRRTLHRKLKSMRDEQENPPEQEKE